MISIPTFMQVELVQNQKSWLTPQGTVAIALRRNIGNVACSLLGHIILQDIAGCTVSRCEVKSGAAIGSTFTSILSIYVTCFSSLETPTPTTTTNFRWQYIVFVKMVTNFWYLAKIEACCNGNWIIFCYKCIFIGESYGIWSSFETTSWCTANFWRLWLGYCCVIFQANEINWFAYMVWFVSCQIVYFLCIRYCYFDDLLTHQS